MKWKKCAEGVWMTIIKVEVSLPKRMDKDEVTLVRVPAKKGQKVMKVKRAYGKFENPKVFEGAK